MAPKEDSEINTMKKASLLSSDIFDKYLKVSFSVCIIQIITIWKKYFVFENKYLWKEKYLTRNTVAG